MLRSRCFAIFTVVMLCGQDSIVEGVSLCQRVPEAQKSEGIRAIIILQAAHQDGAQRAARQNDPPEKPTVFSSQGNHGVQVDGVYDID